MERKTVRTIWNTYNKFSARIRAGSPDESFDIEVSRDGGKSWAYWRTALDIDQAEREANTILDMMESNK